MTYDDISRRPKSVGLILQRTFISIFLIWTAIVAILSMWDIYENHDMFLKHARGDALAAYNKEMAFRSWTVAHGGVYVPVDKNTEPNPYLAYLKERDVTTPSGVHLTLMNPMAIERQVNEIFAKKGEVFGHLSSLKLKNPINNPDKWEEEALKAFEKGETERVGIVDIGGKPFLRLIKPLYVEEGCLKCHGSQGYKIGDIRGGVTESVGLEPYYAEDRALALRHLASYFLLWLIVSIGILAGYRMAKRMGLETEISLQHAKRNAEESNRLKSEILSNMTHELNTPLTSILGFSHIANQHDGASIQKLGQMAEIFSKPENLTPANFAEARTLAKSASEDINISAEMDRVVYQQGRHLTEMLNDLIDFSRLETGHLSFESEAVSASLLLTTTVLNHKKNAEDKGLTFSTNLEDFKQKDLLFLGDVRWIQKVLDNLVENAVKFSSSGEVRVTASLEDDKIALRVKDAGMGIKAQEQKKLFESLQQLDGSLTRPHGGIGMGLAFSKKAANIMKGDITLKSDAGIGSEFTFTVPYRPIKNGINTSS